MENKKESEQQTNTEQNANQNNQGEVSLPKAEYDQLLKKIQELETLKEQMLRSAADYENAKKRIAKEREEYFKYALEGFFYELLPVLDNFERALSHQNDDPAQKSIWSGIELIKKQLAEILKSQGLARMETLKKPFDPHFHEAIEEIINPSKPDHEIAEEIVAGYLLNGKLLRPAKVKVFVKQKSVQEDEKIEEIT